MWSNLREMCMHSCMVRLSRQAKFFKMQLYSMLIYYAYILLFLILRTFRRIRALFFLNVNKIPTSLFVILYLIII